jgi:hypothetical protein
MGQTPYFLATGRVVVRKVALGDSGMKSLEILTHAAFALVYI